MLISRKQNSSLVPEFVMNNTPLDLVPQFKYLEVMLSSNFSWSSHIDSICAKARKMLGMLYRRFYGVTDPAFLLEIYQIQVRPHLEYAAQVWDPHLLKDINHLESVQKFRLKNEHQAMGQQLCRSTVHHMSAVNMILTADITSMMLDIYKQWLIQNFLRLEGEGG